MKNFKKLFSWFVLILIIFTLNTFAAHAKINLPAPVGYVNDFAGVISPENNQKINSLIQELKSKTRAEVVVVTLESLKGYPIEDVSLQIGREWKIGQKDKNNGLVILVAPKDRKMRIEVGYGLEGYLTDAQAGRIRSDYMIPYFKQGDYDKGIYNGTFATVLTLAKGYGVNISGNYTLPEPVKSKDPPDLFLLLFIIFIIIASTRRGFFFLPLYGGGFSSGGNSFGGGSFGGGSFGGFSGGGGFGGGGASGGW